MTLSYSGNELAGEVGEMIEVLYLYALGNEISQVALRDEIGDVIICCDLLAARFDITFDPIPNIPQISDSATSIGDALIEVAMKAGRVCNTVKKLERAGFGMVGSTSSIAALETDLNLLVRDVFWLARLFFLDAGACAAEKFNKTSAKYGLQTIMVS